MPRQSSGSYIAPANTAAVSGQTISSAAFNTLETDIGNEVTNSLDRLGRGAMQAPLNFGGFKAQNAADPASAQDLVTLNYLGSTFSVSSSKVISWLGYTPANKAGDTFTGQITVAPVAGAGNAVLSKTITTGGASVNIYGASNLLARWGISLGDGTAESGGNAGSNFDIAAFDDSGAALSIPLSINRATGRLTVGYGLSLSGGATLDSLTVSGTAAFSGTTTAPTIGAATDNSTNVATTAFAQAAISYVITHTPSFSAGATTTGSSATDNSATVANTAFVQSAISYVIANAPSLGSATTNGPSAGDNSARVPNTNWVWSNAPAVNAAIAFMALSDFALAQYSGGGTVNAGANIAASTLFIPGTGAGNVGGTPTGTWRCQGFALASPSTDVLAKRVL